MEMKSRHRKQQRKPTAKSDSGVEAPQEVGVAGVAVAVATAVAVLLAVVVFLRGHMDDDDDDMNMIMDMDMEDGDDDQDQDQDADHDPVNDAMSDLEALFHDNFSDDEDGEEEEPVKGRGSRAQSGLSA